MKKSIIAILIMICICISVFSTAASSDTNTMEINEQLSATDTVRKVDLYETEEPFISANQWFSHFL